MANTQSRWALEDELALAVHDARRRFLAASGSERRRLKVDLVAALERLSAELFGDCGPTK